MAIRKLKEKNVQQEMANGAVRLCEVHFVRDTYDGAVALAFLPNEGGHVPQYRLDKRQAEELTEWLMSTL